MPKLTTMNWNGTLSSPQYQVAYSSIGNLATARSRSRKVVGGLVGDHDLILELNDSLLCTPEKDRTDIAEVFRAAVAAQGLTITERRYPSTSKPSFLSRLLGQSKESETCELRAYVPNAVWKTGVLDDALTAYGLRYFVLPAGTDGPALLERLNLGTIAAKEIIDLADIILFDVPCFGQMGVISVTNTVEQIKARLVDPK